ncbi:SpaA isopeptide-forming pilin-related protein [Isobaculum melis]|uniref:LPXTG-motif cell wall anchor domain-containing protein n=1 Tax=Isobaculum melis TaxID=142588 RepID=A0A1H9TP78_9LACT|nr:SpaA isopeptide-forming pilin-related protein [Isobaculum melis]SER98921.1 LPXTG-motif cell wall anchor domain-containing protein [Isobaculum melis]
MKIIKKILTLSALLLVFLGTAKEVFAATATATESTGYRYKVDRNGGYLFGDLLMIKVDGQYSFCLEPEVLVQQGDGYTPEDMPTEMREDLSRIVHFGYDVNPTKHNYAVTQFMIWEYVGGVIDWSQTNVPNYEERKSEILNAVAGFNSKPSFHLQNVEVDLGKSVTLTDTNNVLSSYKTVKPTAGLDVSIQGNNLIITPNENATENERVIIQKIPDNELGSSIVFKKKNSQTLGTFKLSDPSASKIDVKVNLKGNAEVLKLDEGTGEVVPNTEFLFEYDGKSETIKTDKNGVAMLEGILHNTKVKVTETFVPAPYVLNKNNTKEIVIQGGKTVNVEFKNQRATGKTTLTKQDKTTESNIPLNTTYPMLGAKYGLFKSDGTLVKEFTLGEKMSATMDKLELGSYYWQETLAPTGYILDLTKHVVELTYKDQFTAVVVKDALSDDDVIRMNMDGQKLIQNDTNEMLKNDVEFTLTNQRTGEELKNVTATVDGKKGYFSFKDLPLDDYVLTETKGVDGYKNIDPISITHKYDKETDSFMFTVKDQKTGNLLNEETITQLELSQGENVDLGTYTLKDKAEKVEKPVVGISTKAHLGDGEKNTFVWGEDVKFYDDVKISHKNIEEGTARAYQTILVVVYPDGTEKDVWTSEKVDYTVTDKEMTERVLAEYDYKQDEKGTRYYFKEIGYNKLSEKEYEKDSEHNFDGNEKTQDITPTVKDEPKELVEPEKPVEPKEPTQILPSTGEKGNQLLIGIGCLVVMFGLLVFFGRPTKEKQNKEQ